MTPLFSGSIPIDDIEMYYEVYANDELAASF